MADLRSFVDVHGVRTIVRRHFEYRKPANLTDPNSFPAMSMVYARQFDPASMGLTALATQAALEQGVALTESGIAVAVVYSGIDQRNIDGARATAEGIESITKNAVPCLVKPSLTYPYYRDATQTTEALKTYGDQAVHMWLAESPEVADLCTESAHEFEERIMNGVFWSDRVPTLFDLNFEAMVLLHYRCVEKIERGKIPCNESAWCPVKGGMIVFGLDGAVTEFNPDFTSA